MYTWSYTLDVDDVVSWELKIKYVQKIMHDVEVDINFIPKEHFFKDSGL